jgi:PAS domain S-box-containing protein
MSLSVRRHRSLRDLVIALIAGLILPTTLFAAWVATRLATVEHRIGEAPGINVGLMQIGLGGLLLLLLCGWIALVTVRRISASMKALSDAALALGNGEPMPPVSATIAEMHEVIQSLKRAGAALAKRSAERERAEAAMLESDLRMHDFAETASDWFWETDIGHRFSYLSSRNRALLPDTAERMGKTPWECAVDAGSDPEKWREHRALMERHEPFRGFVYETKVKRRVERTFSVSGKPVFGASGEFLGYRGTARDITEEIRAERALRKAKIAADAANLAKSRFLANTSHELRTPLNAIIGFSEMLQAGYAGPLQPRQDEYINLIHQSGTHLLTVINAILDLAKIEAGKLDLYDKAPVHPAEIAQNCVDILRESARDQRLRLSLAVDPALAPIVADATRLKQILLNLLANAIKFTPADGEVALGVRRDDAGAAEFTVSDNGPGMTADEIAIALEPFGQVDARLARRHDGTGLGLPLAKQLAELHGGSLRIDSKPGRGTRVTVTLPQCEPIIAAERRTLLAATG